MFIAAGKTCLTAIRDARHSNPLFQRETDRREGCRHGRPRVEVQGQHDTCGGDCRMSTTTSTIPTKRI
ncbi:hypothetical protein DW075_24685 [Bacteroides xylanisolvens]|uniref:Uncharacterized protein n=1 Tax=Bacteroides xylanisolvens TaxID=371601 RepID=A0A415FCY8_9BACE|nr:hypothetical protein DW075_24685 [Bacteroides xylanisolvens]